MKASGKEKTVLVTQETPDQMKRERNKKIIFTLLIIAVGFVLVYFIANAIIEALFIPNTSGNSDNPTSYVFYEADFNEDITLDKAYMELDRSVYFCDSATGITSNSMEDVPLLYRRYVELISEYIQYATEGKASALNRLFSENYYKNGGEEKKEFTPQKIYNILITYKGPGQIEGADECISGYSFWLEYMIRKNNGTFRNDMASDCTKKELFTVSENNGKIEIEAVYSFRTVDQNSNELNCGSLAPCAAMIIPIIAAACIPMRKRKNV